MARFFKIVAAIVFILILSQEASRADFWARTDGAGSYWELRHAIHYCRVVPRVTERIPVFMDLLMGREIDRCMYALGWIGVAR
jgi:hypothetical protein